MTGYNSNINAYKKAFANVDNINQVIMLYDTAIASMQQVKQAIADKNIEERFNKLSKVFKILTGLRDALDHGAGGDVAVVLSEWYSSTAYRVLSINRSEDIKMVDACIDHIKQMRDAWVDVEKQVKAGSAEGSTSNEQPANTSGNNGDFFETVAKAAYGPAQKSGLVINV